LRRDVLDTLARRAEYNLARMEGNLRLFEIGSVFEPRAGQLPHEELHVAAVVMGRRVPRHFTDPKSPEFESWAVYNEWDVKALAVRVGQSLSADARITMIDADDREAEAGLLWTVTINGEPIGEVRRLTLDAPVWAAPAFGLELTFGVVESAD